MKKIILSVIACVVGAVMLVGGVAFSKVMSNYYTLDFDNYEAYPVGIETEEMSSREAFKAARITYPRYLIAYSGIEFDARLTDCYKEVQSPCCDYALAVAIKYQNNADLTFTVENTGKLLTIKFTGTGYPENGEPVDLSRTYIFDIDGAGVNKLPRLVNRADFIGY